MILRLAPLLFALLTLAGCNKPDTPPAATPVADAAAPATDMAASAPVAVDADHGGGTEAATPAPAGPIVPPSGPAPIAGTDYVEIAGGQPFQPGTGKIEVVEVFGYTCGHCASFEPLLSAWKAKLPADVQFTAVAAPFGGFWTPYAKAFYTAEAMGLLGKTHDAMFRAIHVERSLPVQPPATPEQIAGFYARYGANPQQFISTMSSFAVDAKLKRAEQFIARSGVDSTPTIVVEGKYRVTAKSLEDNLRVAEHLIAQERAARAGTAAATPAAGG